MTIQRRQLPFMLGYDSNNGDRVAIYSLQAPDNDPLHTFQAIIDRLWSRVRPSSEKLGGHSEGAKGHLSKTSCMGSDVAGLRLPAVLTGGNRRSEGETGS